MQVEKDSMPLFIPLLTSPTDKKPRFAIGCHGAGSQHASSCRSLPLQQRRARGVDGYQRREGIFRSHIARQAYFFLCIASALCVLAVCKAVKTRALPRTRGFRLGWPLSTSN
jgi:hypothetical protein